MAETATDTPLDSIVERYIKLRDKKGEMKKAYDASVAPIDTAMERCEAFIMATLNQVGGDNVKTKFGTAYKKTNTFASVADWPMILEWVKANDGWGMLKRDVSKAFVESYKEEHNDLPPGINWRMETVINVKRN